MSNFRINWKTAAAAAIWIGLSVWSEGKLTPEVGKDAFMILFMGAMPRVARPARRENDPKSSSLGVSQ